MITVGQFMTKVSTNGKKQDIPQTEYLVIIKPSRKVIYHLITNQAINVRILERPFYTVTG